MIANTQNTVTEMEPHDLTRLGESSLERDATCGMHRGQFRQYQINMRNRQIQTELLVSIVLGTTVCTVYWDLIPKVILLSWAAAIILMVGARSLFIYSGNGVDNPEEIIAWGDSYTILAAISGIFWGCLGIMTILYCGVESYQFTMIILICISLTVFISSQSSPHVVAAFMLPALLPNGVWFFIQDGGTTRFLGIVVMLTFWLMLASSRVFRDMLLKSLSLSTHNTELIHKLVIARESAELATRYA